MAPPLSSEALHRSQLGRISSIVFSASRVKGNDGLELQSHVGGEGVDADGEAGVLAAGGEDVDEQVRGAVDHCGVIDEVRGGVDGAGDVEDLSDPGEAPEFGAEGGEEAERRESCRLCSLFDAEVVAELAGDQAGPVEGNVAGGVERRSVDDGHHVAAERRERVGDGEAQLADALVGVGGGNGAVISFRPFAATRTTRSGTEARRLDLVHAVIMRATGAGWYDMFMTETAIAGSRPIVVVVYPGFQGLDVMGPCDVLAQANVHRPGTYSIDVAGTRRQVTTSAGVTLNARRFDDGVGASIDTLVVPGARAEALVALLADGSALASIRTAAGNAQRIASVCSGAFVLARLGLLARRRATTHWSGWDLLVAADPTIVLERDRLVVRDGNVWTSGGVASGMDLALALVEEDCGADVALAVSRDIVMPLRRRGQAAYAATDRPGAGDATESPVLREIHRQTRRRITVVELAEAVGMSPRTLHRHCLEHLGSTPGRLIVDALLDRARAELIASGSPIKEIAQRTGFSDESALSRAFARTYGMTPRAFRESFHSV